MPGTRFLVFIGPFKTFILRLEVAFFFFFFFFSFIIIIIFFFCSEVKDVE
jgi:hypothetical protein